MIAEVRNQNTKLTTELNLMKSYVIYLETRLNCQQSQIATLVELRKASRQIMQGPVSAYTYNTLVYRFTDKDGHTHNGYDDD
ncbi:uncharacterized protein [Mytilus edulis]|uniref:uncharacterized protein n=1 Tax=Mytilus edulis TaxID=6550 RepID=UPI0039F0E8D1